MRLRRSEDLPEMVVATRRRLIVAPSEYPDSEDPLKFNGSWAEEQTRALSRRHEIAVVYPLMVSGREAAGIDAIEHSGVRAFVVHYRHIRKTWISPYIVAMWRGIKRAGEDFQPECIHAHGLYPAGLAAVIVGRLLGLPAVITEHWGQLDDRTSASPLIQQALKYTMRRAARLIAVSEFSAAEMQRLEPRCSPVVIPNVVAPIFFERVSGAPRPEKERVDLLFVGSIRDYRKGLDVLLKALRLYSDLPAARKWQLKVIGEGACRKEFEELAQNLSIAGQCEFAGAQSRYEVAQAMAACDLFIMPSRYETFGVVYAEAMACGKPVIACQGGPAAEIVPSWAGELVPVDDVPSLTQAIDRVIAALPSYDPHRISEYARRAFEAETIAARVSEIYERVLQSGAVLSN